MKVIKILGKLTIILSILCFFAVCGLYLYAYFMPKISLNSANSIYMYDGKDNLIMQGSSNKDWVNLDNIDDKFLNYIINIEDQHFYTHKGFDVLRIIKTLFINFKKQKITAGASSISQQYVKNLFLEFDQTWERKIEEAFLTMRLETHYSKDEILEGYLNTINFGQGMYGISNASKYYFNKDISDISIEEAIILAGIPKSPNNYNPISNLEGAKKRFNIVAKILYDNNTLTEEEYNNLNFDNVKIYGRLQDNSLDTLMYYRDAVIEELYSLDSIPKSLIKSGGLRIFTNLDVDTQMKMEESIKKNVKLEDENQIAAIIVDPNNGKVLALAGGKDYSISQYNRVMKSKRQVGSTIKPFLYYTALNNGMTSASTFRSEQTTFVFAENKTYSPTNYGDKYGNKDITMNAALAYSDNVFAVKTHLFLGESALVNTLKICGLKQDIYQNPSLALGAIEINMFDYAKAYSTIASGGSQTNLYFINRVEDINGNILYVHKDKSFPVLESDTTYILNEMMRNTYNYNYVDFNSPTVIYLNGKMSHKYALKSGTTENDYWIVGYNKEALMMVWAGNDYNENVPKTYSKNIKNIWLDTIEYYENSIDVDKNSWYEMPSNVVAVPMNPITGTYDAKSKSLFYFINGTQAPYMKK